MKTFAITGRSGCGKSSVTSVIQNHGYPIVDGDELSRNILIPGSPCLPLLQQAFGMDILDENGVLKRRLLADRAFISPDQTALLNIITHPEIMRRMLAAQQKAKETGSPFFFIDGAVIIGTPFEALCGDIILVTAPYETSVARICKRDGISPEMARRRLDAQPPEENLSAKSRYILANDGSLEEICLKTENLLAALLQAKKQDMQ